MSLLPAESNRLTHLENTIERGLQTFVEVGAALLEIRDGSLYRDSHATFEAYCQERWGMTRDYAYKQIGAANVYHGIQNAGLEVAPTSERQARALTSLPPTAQPEVWQRAVDTAPDGRITAAHVAAIVSDYKAQQQEQTAQRREARIDKIIQISQDEPPPIASLSSRYAVIYADPPWRYEHSRTDSRVIENHYPTMELDDICALPVAKIATPDAILFLWATNPKLQEALQVVAAWGFTYRTNMVWDKEKIGMGYYARQQHELLLICTRGSIPAPLPATRVSSVYREARGKHSQKPTRYYELIETMYPHLPRIELFARASRDCWDSWGYEA